MPAGTVPCGRCSSTAHAVSFRGWDRVASLIIAVDRQKMAGFFCPTCVRFVSAMNLAWTGILGWWSIPAVLWIGWRATYTNWRAVWAAPRNPISWGAPDAIAFIAGLQDKAVRADVESNLEHTPFGPLSSSEREMVFAASGLYELLGCKATTSTREIRQAYVALAKVSHPDAAPSEQRATAAETMIALNRAWEILGDDRLRAAYDFKTALE